jgi:metal-sulfur cluster biosynthetic enzyme
MKGCFDPEIPINIVDLGLVYECNIVKKKGNLREVFIKMTLTTPSCGMGDVLAEDVKYRVEMVPTIAAVHVQLVFDPPWSRDRMSDFAKLKMGMY